MTLVLVDGMPDTPGTCALCGGNPIDEVTGGQQQAIFAEGVDIDWGNSLYICMSCAHIIANLIDRATQGGFDRAIEERDEWKSKYEDLKEEHEEQQEILDQIRAGAAARKRLKERV